MVLPGQTCIRASRTRAGRRQVLRLQGTPIKPAARYPPGASGGQRIVPILHKGRWRAARCSLVGALPSPQTDPWPLAASAPLPRPRLLSRQHPQPDSGQLQGQPQGQPTAARPRGGPASDLPHSPAALCPSPGVSHRSLLVQTVPPRDTTRSAPSGSPAQAMPRPLWGGQVGVAPWSCREAGPGLFRGLIRGPRWWGPGSGLGRASDPARTPESCPRCCACPRLSPALRQLPGSGRRARCAL